MSPTIQSLAHGIFTRFAIELYAKGRDGAQRTLTQSARQETTLIGPRLWVVGFRPNNYTGYSYAHVGSRPTSILFCIFAIRPLHWVMKIRNILSSRSFSSVSDS